MNTEQDTDTRQQSFLYKLLMNPGKGFRRSRHLLLLLGLFSVSFNQAYMGFFEYTDMLGSNLYLCTFVVFVTYVFEGYFNMYVLIPKLLLKGKYLTYFIVFFLLVLFFVLLHFSMEYAVLRLYNVEPGIYSYFKSQGSPFWLEILAAYFLDSIAVMGAGLFVLLKHWLVHDKRMHQLEKKHIETELAALKEQVSPQFLLSILHKIGDTAIEDQQKASDMLMELSEILRYQLYDSNRDSVLLNAEIQFITTYLGVEKLYSEKMNYTIRTEGDITRMLIPPLLFFPIIQNVVRDFRKESYPFSIDVSFRSDVDSISFYCNCRHTELLAAKDFYRIKQRLEKLYKNRHQLVIEEKPGKAFPHIWLQISL